MKAMKAYREVEVQLHIFVTSTLDKRGWSTSRCQPFMLEKDPPPRYLSSRRVRGPTSGLEILKNLEHLCPCLEVNPDLSSRSYWAYWLNCCLLKILTEQCPSAAAVSCIARKFDWLIVQHSTHYKTNLGQRKCLFSATCFNLAEPSSGETITFHSNYQGHGTGAPSTLVTLN